MENNLYSSVPNITMWSWMRTVLNLSGSELLIFSYLFSQTFDSVHKCYTTLGDMEQWFGVTRQTISRNIDTLASKGFVIKQTMKDKDNTIIKHNSYYVNMSNITELCEKANFDNYSNFIDCYRSMLTQRFPNQIQTIDEHLEALLNFHKNKDKQVCMTMNELVKLINSDSDESIPELLLKLREEKEPKHFPKRSYIEQVEVPKQEAKPLLTKKPRKSKQALRNEWYEAKKQMSSEFVMLRADGNSELLEALDEFLTTDNGMSYNPTQWQQQLDNLYKYGRTIQRMIDGVRISHMNNYRQLYIPDRNEVEIDEKLQLIEEYVAAYGESSDKLKELLVSYVSEVPKAKSYTAKQFKLALKNLTALCPTLEDKLRNVEMSYTYSYSALAYPGANTSNSQAECDMELKLAEIDKFIADGYYYLCDNLKELLVEYVTTTKFGKSANISVFRQMLANLRLMCLDDSEKVVKISMAIQNNSSKFATEDFEESRKIRAKHESRESMAASFDRSRKHNVMIEKRRHPNDPRLKDVTLDKTEQNVV